MKWGVNTIQISTAKIGSKIHSEFLRQYRWNAKKVLEIPHPFNKYGNNQPKRVENKRIALIFGFVRPGKGIEIAIKAMSDVAKHTSDLHLFIAGSPVDIHGKKYLEYLKKLISNLNLQQQITFKSEFIPKEDVPDLFRRATVVLIPYTDSVGVSGPVHNYASIGTPFIISDTGYHHRDTLGGHVITFPSQDHKELARILLDLTHDKIRLLSTKQIEYTSSHGWMQAIQHTLKNYKQTICDDL